MGGGTLKSERICLVVLIRNILSEFYQHHNNDIILFFRGLESINTSGENISHFWNNLIRFRKSTFRIHIEREYLDIAKHQL